MKWISYSKYTGEDLGLSSEDLMRALSDFFLQSGFENQYMSFGEMDKHSLERLREALEEALRNGEMFEQSMRDAMQQKLENMSPEEMDGLVDRLIRKLSEDGYIAKQEEGSGGGDSEPRDVKFDITDKSVDFLGFKTLKDLLAGLGRASFGAHDTRELATGVEASGSSRPYEFGDTLNLDVGETLFSAMRREGVGLPLNLEYPGSARASERISEFVRDGADAGLLAQHDPVRRGPLHSGEEGGARAGASDSHAVSGRLAEAGAVS
jgi:Ca-activated chloride channel family protein